MSEANLAVARRWFHEVWNERRHETIDELLHADAVCAGEAEPVRGVAEFRARMHGPFLSAFPDLRVQVDDALAVGDQVVVRWSAVGTHTGDGLGFPATGKTARLHGMTWLRIQGGQLVEGWQYSNLSETFRSLAGGAGHKQGATP